MYLTTFGDNLSVSRTQLEDRLDEIVSRDLRALDNLYSRVFQCSVELAYLNAEQYCKLEQKANPEFYLSGELVGDLQDAIRKLLDDTLLDEQERFMQILKLCQSWSESLSPFDVNLGEM